MALPILFIGVAAATGGLGLDKTVHAALDARNASKINTNANELVAAATKWVNQQREACGKSLTHLGEEKIFVINSTITEFLATYSKIKNVNFRDSEGLEELSKMHIDQQDFVELQQLANFATSMAGGAVAGTAGGALVAFGAYGAAQTLAVASTGTAISSLSGVAASNATLAFFGGGSLASGGLGIAGGTAVLGGLVAGPALLVLGFAAGNAAKKELDKALTNRAEAIELATELDKTASQCEAIRRRTYVYYNLLARLDSYFLPLIYKMEDIVKNEGDDYKLYSPESKKVISQCATFAGSIKAVLDTPILSDDGLLTEESEKISISTEDFLKRNAISY